MNKEDLKLYNEQIDHSEFIFQSWKEVPAPQRGEFIKMLGEVFKKHKIVVAEAITQDTGKTINESLGEVQEVIDMCVFAAGLSRQLYGKTMPSERANHRIQETWQPLGPIGVITAFNFPVAVWGWNFCVAAICGNTVVWKPSEKTPLSTMWVKWCWENTCIKMDKQQFFGVNTVLDSNVEYGKNMAIDKRLPLISATGSVRMGEDVAQTVASRMGKCLLELGGNNATVISQFADVDLAIKGCVFGAVGTSGQRCTTTRRIFPHRSILDTVVDKMVRAYRTITIGDPMSEATLMGPLIDEVAFDAMQEALEEIRTHDEAKIIYGGDKIKVVGDSRFYVTPCIVVTTNHLPIMQRETFAPIVYVMPYDTIGEALELVNCVEQGLSNSIFTNNIIEAELFLARAYSGIVNVNAGTSGAEIGGAFGGEKDTGGGRESGSDSWKQYMRRVTSTINYSQSLPLAQGIKFDV